MNDNYLIDCSLEELINFKKIFFKDIKKELSLNEDSIRKSLNSNKNIILLKNKIKEKLLINNFIIIRNLGTDLDLFILINILISDKLYFSERMNLYIHSFRNKVLADELSEDLSSGGFHTDFSFQDKIPDFISLQCKEPDPKYPYLGRNYFSYVDNIFNILVKNFDISEKYLLNIKLPYTLKNETIWNNPFVKENNKIEMKLHLKLVDSQKLGAEHYIDGIPISELINQIALSISKDFVLNKGDIAIFSNRYLLHKRGECSIDLINRKSRELNSMRFFI
ncbi:hypothetical protein [Malaciobacter marinus]|jgi:hypothetical protein|uniref:hypothetical protein n=1 Tax=Malaciobacter marinus TaxID=505249 RepID=UPI0009A7996D|nr:hypothetical protein [Malaciobacter marinus]SKB31042.1 hypothetical protein SAMN06295997_104141 [Malaciobacter marinus]